MLRNHARAGVAAMLLLSLAACGRYALVTPVRTTVQNSSFAVQPSLAWNKLNNSTSNTPVELWTIDGEMLHSLSFMVISDGKPLVKAQNMQKGQEPPVFKASMSREDIASLYEASLTRTANTSVFTMRAVKPVLFLGGEGVRMEFSYANSDSIDRQGIAVAGVRDGKLYIISYVGTKRRHFPHYLPEVERIIDSATLSGVTKS